MKMNIKVCNMTSPRSGRPVSNQFIVRIGNVLYFQSYKSVVCSYNTANGLVCFGRDWDYSVTTRKYLYQFLNENGVTLPTGKSGADSIRKGIKQGLFSYNPELF